MKRKNKCIYKNIILIVFIILTFTTLGCKGIKEEYSKSGFAFDTIISISIYDNNKNHADKVLSECINLCDYYDSIFSAQNPNSDIYKINHADSKPVKVSKDTFEIIKASIIYSEKSKGLLDITIEPLYELWDFNSTAHTRLPSEEEIQNAITSVGYKAIKLCESDQTIALTSSGQITLGALAKGYIADRLKEYLINEGIDSGIINLGGNILVFGEKSDGSSYKIGIQKPFSQNGEIISSISVDNKSVVTSGTYQRYFKYNDTIYHHIINPFSGYPCDNDLDSVTVITENSLDADAYSTICILLGYEKSKEFLQSIDNVSAIFIDKNGNKKELGK